MLFTFLSANRNLSSGYPRTIIVITIKFVIAIIVFIPGIFSTPYRQFVSSHLSSYSYISDHIYPHRSSLIIFGILYPIFIIISYCAYHQIISVTICIIIGVTLVIRSYIYIYIIYIIKLVIHIIFLIFFIILILILIGRFIIATQGNNSVKRRNCWS